MPDQDALKNLLLSLYPEHQTDLLDLAKEILGVEAAAYLPPASASLRDIRDKFIVEMNRHHDGVPTTLKEVLIKRFPGRRDDILAVLEPPSSLPTPSPQVPSLIRSQDSCILSRAQWLSLLPTWRTLFLVVVPPLVFALLAPSGIRRAEEWSRQRQADEQDALTLDLLRQPLDSPVPAKRLDYMEQYALIKKLRTEAARHKALGISELSPLNRARLFAGLYSCWGPFHDDATTGESQPSCYEAHREGYLKAVLSFPLDRYPPFEVIPAVVSIPGWRFIDREQPLDRSGEPHQDPTGARALGVIRLSDFLSSEADSASRATTYELFFDRFEATFAEVEHCSHRGACDGYVIEPFIGIFHPGKPATMVLFSTAQQVCEVAGGRLPDAAEWVHAASQRAAPSVPTLYTWGNEIRTDLIYTDFNADSDGSCYGKINRIFGNVAPVGACWFLAHSQSRGRQFEPIDLVGNVWEMVSPTLGEPSEGRMQLRGGAALSRASTGDALARKLNMAKPPSYSPPPIEAPTARSRQDVGLATSAPLTGFRCVLLSPPIIESLPVMPGGRR